DRVLGAAGRAPAAPDVEQVGFAKQFGRTDLAPGLMQRGQRELRCRPADQRRGQGFAIRAIGLADAVQQQAEQHHEEAEDEDRDEAAAAAGGNGRVHRDSLGAARKRRSAAVTKPPSAISNAPAQIQRTNGLMCRRTAQVSPPSDSPNATKTSALTPASMPASVITWPPLA